MNLDYNKRNLYYEIDDSELIEKHGARYFVEFDAKIWRAVDPATFQPTVGTWCMRPFRFCIVNAWIEKHNEIDKITVQNGSLMTGHIQPFDSKEFLFAKLSAKRLTTVSYDV